VESTANRTFNLPTSHLSSGIHDATDDQGHDLCDEELHGIITVCILIFFSFCTTVKSPKHQPIAHVCREEVKEKGTRSHNRMAIETICRRSRRENHALGDHIPDQVLTSATVQWLGP
jgi:hypothetical protein